MIKTRGTRKSFSSSGLCEDEGCKEFETDHTPPLTGQPEETVHHPAHYGGDTTYETIKVLEAWLTHTEYVGFLKGNVIKYLSRATRTNNHNENIAKATWYQNELDKYLKEYVG